MELDIIRYTGRKDSSGGLLFIDHIFHCFTCEDEKREIKIAGETRIPEGRYQILLRDEGGMTKRYARKFPEMHQGMLHLQNVPNFKWIYIHVGNTDDHTAGCPLVGYGTRVVNDEIQVMTSTDAYKDLYKMIVAAMGAGEEVWVNIKEIQV